MKKTEGKKISKKALYIILAAVSVLIIAGVSLFLLTPSFSPNSTGYHVTKNALPEKYDYLPYLKDGNIYIYENGKSQLVGEKAYDANVPSTVAQVDYVWNLETRQIVFMADPQGERILMHYKDGVAVQVAKNVISWRTIASFEKIAVVTSTNPNSETGALLQYSNGTLVPLDNQIESSSIRYSPDGAKLFALKQTSSASASSTAMLVCYDAQGNRETLENNVFSLAWVSQDGNTYIANKEDPSATGEYNYRITNTKGKTTKVNKVYLSSTTADSSIIYMIADYDTTSATGSLIAMDTATLQRKKLADNVSYINPDAVTDLSKGIVYSTPGSQAGRYNICYSPIKGKTLVLIKNGFENSIFSISLNTQQQNGYILVHGVSASQNSLYSIKWNDKELKSVKLDSGAIHEIVYYEACDTLLYIKNGNVNKAELYSVKGEGQPNRLLTAAGAIYDKENDAYYSCSFISNDGKKLLYFTDITVITESTDDPFYTHPLANKRGTLMMLDLETYDITEIAENVQADYYDSVLSNGDMSRVYYNVLKENAFNLYLFQNGESTLIAEKVSGNLKHLVY